MPTDIAFDRNYIINDYQKRFNRTPNEQEINVHLKNPGGRGGFDDTQNKSDEWMSSQTRVDRNTANVTGNTGNPPRCVST